MYLIDNGEVPIVAWDGEGHRHQRHRFVLWAAHDGRGHVEIIDRVGLRTIPCLDLIWRMHRARRGAIHVIYGGGYDFNQILKELDKDSAKHLHHGGQVLIGPFVVRYNGTWLEVWRRGARSRPVQLWDVWRFWNKGFEQAVRDNLPGDPDLGIIQEGKARREEWGQMDELDDAMLAFMTEYNRAELRALVRLVRQLYRDLDAADIPLPSFLTGAGSLAGALMGKHGVAKYRGDPEFGNPAVYHAVLGAFGAGRIDDWQIGRYDKPIWTHDLRSAYASAQLELPDLSRGKWRWADELSTDWNDRFSVWMVRWNWVGGYNGGPRPEPPTRRYYPFFYRTEKGGMLFPPAGSGWQWWPEVVTAGHLGWQFEIVGGYIWEPEFPSLRPFDWQREAYVRRQWIRDSLKMTGAANMLKHGLAAVYGKTCQATGTTQAKPNRYHNLAWAGWTTSYTRARIMAVAHQNPDAVIYQMTDSVAATSRLVVDEGPMLGQWEVEEWARGVIAQAGVGSLWCYQCKDHPEGGEHPKYRGFDSNTISAEAIVQTWRDNKEAMFPNAMQTWTRRPINLGSALTGQRFSEWGDWEVAPRDLHVYGGGGKRRVEFVWEHWEPWKELIPIEPAAVAYAENGAYPLSLDEMTDCFHAGVMKHLPFSAPYEPKWASEDPYALPVAPGRLTQRRLLEEDQAAGEHV